MSMSRGMLRCWLAGTALWVVAVGGAGYVDLRDGHPFSGLYSYSTSKEDFVAQPYDASDDTIEEGVERGIITRTSFPDGTTLVAPQDQGDAKLQEIAQRFWEERWQRRAEALYPWGVWALTPPVLALLLGMLMPRFGRGVRPGTAAPQPAQTAAHREPHREPQRAPVAPAMPTMAPITAPAMPSLAEEKPDAPKPADAPPTGEALESAAPETPKVETPPPEAPPVTAGSPEAAPAPFIQTLGPDVKRAIAQRRAARASSRFDLTRARKSAKTD